MVAYSFSVPFSGASWLKVEVNGVELELLLSLSAKWLGIESRMWEEEFNSVSLWGDSIPACKVM
jgi:hypothetical protein